MELRKNCENPIQVNENDTLIEGLLELLGISKEEWKHDYEESVWGVYSDHLCDDTYFLIGDEGELELELDKLPTEDYHLSMITIIDRAMGYC